MKCIKCGNEFTNPENICPNCGTKNEIQSEILNVNNGPQSFTRNSKDISIEELMNGKKEETNKLDFEIQGNVKKEGVLSDFNQSSNNELANLVISEKVEEPKKKSKKGLIIGGAIALLLIILTTTFILLKDDKKELKPTGNKTEEKQPIEENPSHNIEEPTEPENPENPENPEDPEDPENPEDPEDPNNTENQTIEPSIEPEKETKKVTYTPLSLLIPYEWDFTVTGNKFIGRNEEVALYLTYIPGSYDTFLENIDVITETFKNGGVNVTSYNQKTSHNKNLLIYDTNSSNTLVIVTNLGEQYTIEALVQYQNTTYSEAIDKIAEILSTIKGKLPDASPKKIVSEDKTETIIPYEFKNELIDTEINLFTTSLR